MLATRQMLSDRYRLDRSIASGAAGDVWQATDTVLRRQVAVKVLRSSSPDGMAARFVDEARTMAVLRHPGVVEVYDFGDADGVAYLVMAYVEGEPLNDRIANRGRLTAAETMPIVARVARALDAVHQAGVVHRDVKPGNLILPYDGEVIIVDFGIAHAPRAVDLTAADEVVGTPLYMAPEQVAKQPITPATDIYALGAVAYHCLAGRPPFPGDNPITVALQHLHDEPPPLPADVPEAARRLVATAMAKDPALRFASAAAMADAAETSDPIPSPRTLVIPPVTETVTVDPVRADRRRQGLAALAMTTLALLALFALMMQTGTLPSVPGMPSDPRPNPTGTLEPGQPAGGTATNPDGSPGQTQTPEPGGVPSPSGAGEPATTTPPPATAEPTAPAETAPPPQPQATPAASPPA